MGADSAELLARLRAGWSERTSIDDVAEALARPHVDAGTLSEWVLRPRQTFQGLSAKDFSGIHEEGCSPSELWHTVPARSTPASDGLAGRLSALCCADPRQARFGSLISGGNLAAAAALRSVRILERQLANELDLSFALDRESTSPQAAARLWTSLAGKIHSLGAQLSSTSPLLTLVDAELARVRELGRLAIALEPELVSDSFPTRPARSAARAAAALLNSRAPAASPVSVVLSRTYLGRTPAPTLAWLVGEPVAVSSAHLVVALDQLLLPDLLHPRLSSRTASNSNSGSSPAGFLALPALGELSVPAAALFLELFESDERLSPSLRLGEPLTLAQSTHLLDLLAVARAAVAPLLHTS